MADKPAPGSPDLTPLFVLLLIIIIAGLGSVRSCNPAGPNTGCAQPPPTQTPGPGERPGPPVTTNLKQYTVQAGISTTREGANALAADLRAININNFILQSNGQWVVCVGKFVNAARAEDMVQTLKEYGVSDPKVLPPQKK
jgi:cell division septation protein DedD